MTTDSDLKEIANAELYKQSLKEAQKKVGKSMLSDQDLFVLTCSKLVQTYTFEEKGYT